MISKRFQSVRVNAIELIIHMTFYPGQDEKVGLYNNHAIWCSSEKSDKTELIYNGKYDS